jgi:hypothetical protein
LAHWNTYQAKLIPLIDQTSPWPPRLENKDICDAQTISKGFNITI